MAVDNKDYFVLDKADMVHALSLIMPYGAYLVPMLKQMPVEHLNKIYEANLQHAKEYNHMEDRMREAQNETAILRRRLASYERKSQPTSRGNKNTSKAR